MEKSIIQKFRDTIYTDLALEVAEGIEEKEGVGISYEEKEEKNGVKISLVQITNEKAAKKMNRPQGRYLTLQAKQMKIDTGGMHREISLVLAKCLQEFLPGEAKSFLVVGLGNGKATPDALGPETISHLKITRKISDKDRQISAIIPGVMLQTGMESAEIITGIVKETKPEVVIVIDALCAKSPSRVGCSIQITDTGIQPGSGVGNHRHALTKKSLKTPVIVIGIPTVVNATALICDTLEHLEYVYQNESKGQSIFGRGIDELSEDERYQLFKELLEKENSPLFVTPKDIDELINHLSFILSEGLNIALNKV